MLPILFQTRVHVSVVSLFCAKTSEGGGVGEVYVSHFSALFVLQATIAAVEAWERGYTKGTWLLHKVLTQHIRAVADPEAGSVGSMEPLF